MYTISAPYGDKGRSYQEAVGGLQSKARKSRLIAIIQKEEAKRAKHTPSHLEIGEGETTNRRDREPAPFATTLWKLYILLIEIFAD